MNVHEINTILKKDPSHKYRDIKFLQYHLLRWRNCNARKAMIQGWEYYEGRQDVLFRDRKIIGPDGELKVVRNLPNNKIVDNQYRKMVDQKVNYLLSRPLTFECENESFAEELNEVCDKKFHKLLKNIGKDSYNCGIGWLYVYVNEEGEIEFTRFNPVNVIPFWKDDEEDTLEFLIRVYEVTIWTGECEKFALKVEVYTPDGIDFYTSVNDSLTFDEHKPYLYLNGEEPAKWDRFPVIPFKANSKSQTLLENCKCLQDMINTILSDFQNAMQEDGGTTILILENYDGENLGEFRQNLATYRAVKVSSEGIEGGKGDVRTLNIEVNSENYKTLLDIAKRALIENCKGIDVKDEKLSGNPNQMNIQCMYFDIDQDANEIETEYQCSFERLLWFIATFRNMKRVVAEQEITDNAKVEVIFNRDVMMNESETIQNCVQSTGIISDETILAMHPWVKDVELELKRLEEKKEKELEEFALNQMVANETNNQEDEEF